MRQGLVGNFTEPAQFPVEMSNEVEYKLGGSNTKSAKLPGDTSTYKHDPADFARLFSRPNTAMPAAGPQATRAFVSSRPASRSCELRPKRLHRTTGRRAPALLWIWSWIHGASRHNQHIALHQTPTERCLHPITARRTNPMHSKSSQQRPAPRLSA